MRRQSASSRLEVSLLGSLAVSASLVGLGCGSHGAGDGVGDASVTAPSATSNGASAHEADVAGKVLGPNELTSLGRWFPAMGATARTATFTLEGDHIAAALPTTALRSAARQLAKTRHPSHADGPFEVAVEGASMRVSLQGAAHVAGIAGEGVVQYVGAANGATWLQVPHRYGVEELWSVPKKPATNELRYTLETTGIAGLRQIGNVVELLDASGDPRLRVAHPLLRDADGKDREGALAIEGCAVDRSEALPWGRAVTPPGADRCTVVVRWSDEGLRYPLTIDPAWTSTAGLPTAMKQPQAASTTGSTTGCVSGCVMVIDLSASSAPGTALYNAAAGSWAASGTVSGLTTPPFRLVEAAPGTFVAADAALNTAGYNYPATMGAWSTATHSYAYAGGTVSPLPGLGYVIAGGTNPSTGYPVNTVRFYPGGTTATKYAPNGSVFAVVTATTPTVQHNVCVPTTNDPSATGGTGPVGYFIECAALSNGALSGTWTARASTMAGQPDFAQGWALFGTAWYSSNRSMTLSATAPAFTNYTVTGALGYFSGLDDSKGSLSLVFTGAADTDARTWFAPPATGIATPASLAIARANNSYALLPATGHGMVIGGTVGGVAITDVEIFNPQGAGAACTTTYECSGSLVCADGVCCNTSGGSNASCSGSCEACNLAGSVGTCTPLAAHAQPVSGHTACASPAGGTCGYQCDGTNRATCSVEPASLSCRSATCSAATYTNAASCDGAGNCPAIVSGTCAGHLQCNAAGTACLTSCSTNTDCTSGYKCSGGSCVSTGGAGAACSIASDCSSGLFCTNNVCCAVSSCTAPATCAAGAGSACKIPLGGACSASTASLCVSGFCADGVCCNQACTGSCEECAAMGSVGSCTVRPLGQQPAGTRAACGGTGLCAATCDGIDRAACGPLPSKTASCSTASCASGVATATSYCDGAGTCIAGGTTSCSPYACNGTACGTKCATNTDCASGYHCDTTSSTCLTNGANGTACTDPAACMSGNCVDGVCCATASCGAGLSCSATTNGTCAKPLGATCGTTAECGSGHCVDGVCCNTSCPGQCEECAASGTLGTCTPRPAGKEPSGSRTACVGSGACQATCDGSNRAACGAPPPKTTVCNLASCAGGSATATSYCDGAGACVGGAVSVCAPYACSGSACATKCASNTDCQSGYNCDTVSSTCVTNGANGTACSVGTQCSSGNCVDGVCCVSSSCAAGLACNADGLGTCSKPLATTCSTDGECGSGHCADGVCCDSACTGACEACTLTGHKGTCTPVPSGTQPVAPRASCKGTGACQATCDGTTRGSCAALPGTSTVCAAPTCTGSTLITSSFCDGLGSCAAPAPSSCLPYKCGSSSACALSCATSADCGSGYACKMGMCVTTGALGTVCTDPTQCTSGHCAANPTTGTSVCCTVDSCAAGQECADSSSPTPGVCVAPNGGTCTSGSQCGSGFCTDGVCCDSTCTGSCEACDVPGAVGKCSAVTGAPHGTTRAACPSSTDVCGALTCDGSNRVSCVAYKNGPAVECSHACASGNLAVAKCDGAGNCGSPHSTSCGAYVCNSMGKDCLTSCSSNADCTTNNVCDTASKKCIPAKGTCTADLSGSTDPSTGTTKPCSPYLCDPGSGACRANCGTSADCATGFDCDPASMTCQPSQSKTTYGTSSGGCNCATVGAGAREGDGFDRRAAGLLALGALSVLVRRRGRRERRAA
jgi:hypothetical protein